MPVLRTSPPQNEPGHHGEFELSQKLLSFTMPRVELWFNLMLPGVPEIDLILNSPEHGTYVAEVKAFSLNELSEYTIEKMVRSDGKVVTHPVTQIDRAEKKLRNLITRYAEEAQVWVPFFQRTVIWPKINQGEFIETFQNPLVYDQALGMIFKDDLVDDEALFRALERVTEYHLGAHVPLAVRSEQPGTEILRNLTVDLVPKGAEAKIETAQLSAREQQELLFASHKVSDRLKKYFEGDSFRVAFRGYPGSGKTSALREIGFQHALQGKSVLYISFNKILAAKIRLEIELLMSRSTKADFKFDVYDQYQLYKRYVPSASVSNKASLVLEEFAKLNGNGEIEKYDTILLDEGQDADGELFEILRYCAHEKTSTFVAFGDNQQLYNITRYRGMPAPQLASFLEIAKIEQFNRNFRSGPTTQLICSAISDFYPDQDKAIEWLVASLNARKNKMTQSELDFGEYVYEPTIEILDTPQGMSHARFLVKTVNALIESAELEEEELDALIIVASSASENYKKIIQLLKVSDIPFLDLVESGNRRTPPKPSEVVITTFNGARGLTCKNALVLDLDILQEKSNDPNRPPVNNLLNIGLSRAKNKTIIISGVHDNEYGGREALSFVSSTLELLEN